MRKGKWSKAEDDLMKNHIENYVFGRSWQALSNTLGIQRCGRSCRSRWLNYLLPGLKRGNFTPAEERIICEMYSKMGSCWSVIATQLPGRTDLTIKNYWNSALAKRSATAASRRHRPSSSTTSDARKPDELTLVVYARKPDELTLVVYNEESNTTGSSGHAGILVLGTPIMATSPPVQPEVQPPLTASGNMVKEEPIAAVPISRPVSIKEKPAMGHAPLEDALPPPVEMDIICCAISPIPLVFMELDLPWNAGFDKIDDILQRFDD